MKTSLHLLAFLSAAAASWLSAEAFQPPAMAPASVKRGSDNRLRLRALPPSIELGAEKQDAAAPPTSSPRSERSQGIIFPGGGLFFYWQAGVVVSMI